jgi:hypothetical protein
MSPGQRWTVAVLVVAAVAFGVVVEWRSAFMRRRMTDLGCYARGAWAIRTGTDPYSVTDNNGWHYNYPPFLAILMAPFAEAPPGEGPVVAVPYAASVAVWYVVGLGALVLAVHWLAVAVESSLPRLTRRYGYGWWSMRLVPLVVVLPAAARTLARGQVNTIVVALVAGWAANLVTGRRGRAGVFLAFAVCVKVIPAFLILHPIWRRDGRCLTGLTAGLVFGLVVLPVLASGPTAALAQASTFLDVTLRPGLGAGQDGTRAEELTDVTATDSQSILCVLHNIRFANPWARTPQVAPITRWTYLTLAGLLTIVTLIVHGRRPATARNEVAFIGALAVVMTLVTPINHLHYFVFALPLVTALWSRAGRQVPSEALAFFLLANAASMLPILALRLYGLTTGAALALWVVALFPERPTEGGSGEVVDSPARPLAA